MIVLSVHNHYQQPGGEDLSTSLEVALLRRYGHEVVEYREHNDRIDSMPKLQVAARTVWSRESHRRIRSIIRDRRPDIVHVQNFFPLISPSVFHACRAERVPCVLSVRNYRLACVNGLLLRDGQVCEDCLGHAGPLPGIVHGCYRGSRAGSAVVGTMLVSHRAAGTWNLVDTFIALSNFAREKLIEMGLPGDRIVVKPNFVDPDPDRVRQGSGSYALFVGRISPEKGVDTIVEAWRHVPDLPMRIVGSGPMETALRARVAAAGLEERVEFLGQRSPAEVAELLLDARMLVFPSVWYETFGRVAIEAFAAGVPVIASRLGSMAEIVADGVTGLHFRPGDAEDLAEKVRWVEAHPDEWRRMGERARACFESGYAPATNYARLMEIYTATLRRAGQRAASESMADPSRGEISPRETPPTPAEVSTE